MFDWFFKPKTIALTPENKPLIDWNDPKSKVSKYFTVGETTLLPSWNCHHSPSDEEKQNIIKTAQAMDMVREFVGKPITISVWIRPNKVNCPNFDPKTVKPDTEAKRQALTALDYNAYIGGAKASGHITGKAVDWISSGQSCDSLRAKLQPKLAEFGLCMEDNPGSNWVHNDIMPPRGNTGRFFKP